MELPNTGFPDGYFIIRNTANGRVLDVSSDGVEDGTEVILWPQQETSLVETRRNPDSNNQVFFIDSTGALCSRSSGHAIDIEGDSLVLRHRRPIGATFPNAYSHHLPTFLYSGTSGEITVEFQHDPSFPPPSTSPSESWKSKTYILSAIPIRRPRTILDDASEMLSNVITAPLSLFSGRPPPKKTSLEEVYDADIDLHENEVVETERGEEAEQDDSPEVRRDVKIITSTNTLQDGQGLSEKAKSRRRWEILRLLTVSRRTGGLPTHAY